MKKRMIALLLGSVMLLTCFAGCGGDSESGDGQGDDPGQTEDEEQPEEDGDNQEIVELVWQYPTPSEVGEGFYRMEEALNEMMEKDIGVHVTFEPCDLLTSWNDAVLAVSGGEKLDICLTFGMTPHSLARQGVIVSLEDMMEKYAPDILEQCGEDIIDTCRVDGEVYGVPPMGAGLNAYGYNMKREYAEKYDLMPEEGKIYTLDEIEDMWEIVVAGEGEGTICYVPWNNTWDPMNYAMGVEYDKLGGDFSIGVLMLNEGFDNTTVVNFFETEEYADACRKAYEWAQKGYISADAAVTTDAPDDICRRDNVIGTFAYASMDDRLKQTLTWAPETVTYRTIEPYMTGGAAAATWGVTSTCEHPEKALEALNYLFKNKQANWLIQYGFEGEEYEIVEQEGENYLARFLSDDPASLPYYNIYGVWGNTLNLPVFEPGSVLDNEIKQEIMENLPDSKISPAYGYMFDPEEVSAEVAAIQTVISQYVFTLNAGALNPDEALPEFIAALKDAGIDKVIEENQRQLDEFLEQKEQ